MVRSTTNRHDATRAFGARRIRQRPFVMAAPVKARPIVDIEKIDARGLDPDLRFIGARHRIGDFFVAKNLRTTKFVEDDGFHEDAPCARTANGTLETSTIVQRCFSDTSGPAKTLRFDLLAHRPNN
jgi:hypothetical protein